MSRDGAAYGIPAGAAVLEAMAAAQARMRRLVEAARPGRGREAALAQNARERAWLSENGSRLLSRRG
jgi:hypothetical protein